MIIKYKVSPCFIYLSIASSLVISSLVNADVISENISPDIQEPAGIYDRGNPTLLAMSVTTVIGTGACVTDNYAGCTFNDVLNDINPLDDFKPEIKVHFSADDYPHDGLVSNAEIRQRGGESRAAPQKSFRIKLDKNIPAPLWRGERKIQLMKSAYDPSRIRNKLSYDLFSEIPHFPSMRTQFSHLNVTDQGVTEDYGLFTQIENVGKEYLERRGWNKDSRVYKVEDFGYYDDPELNLDAEGEPVDLVAFEKVLEIKRGENHQNIVNMVRDLNDESIDFNTQIMGKYFNRDNYLTWFAVNLLLNNQDTHFHNYYLYNPKDNNKFYLIPWDYDASFGMVPDTPEITEARLPRWWFSHANFWEIQLHRRFLSEPGNLALLNTAVSEIKNKYLTPEKIQAKRDSYYNIVFPQISSSPDFDLIGLQGNTDPERINDYNQIFAKLSNQVEIQHTRFLERLNDPMTFKMNDPIFEDDHDINFSWGESISLTGQTIIYDLEIATTKEMQVATIIERVENIPTLNHTLHWTHPKGTYYYRVTARDTANPQQHWQVPLNGELFYDNGWLEIQGVSAIFISENGDTSNPSTPVPPPTTPEPTDPTTPNPTTPEEPRIPSSGGGSFSWFLLSMLTSFLFIRKRYKKINNHNQEY